MAIEASSLPAHVKTRPLVFATQQAAPSEVHAVVSPNCSVVRQSPPTRTKVGAPGTSSPSLGVAHTGETHGRGCWRVGRVPRLFHRAPSNDSSDPDVERNQTSSRTCPKLINPTAVPVSIAGFVSRVNVRPSQRNMKPNEATAHPDSGEANDQPSSSRLMPGASVHRPCFHRNVLDPNSAQIASSPGTCANIGAARRPRIVSPPSSGS